MSSKTPTLFNKMFITVRCNLVDPHLVDRIWSIPIWSTSPFGRSQFGRPPHLVDPNLVDWDSEHIGTFGRLTFFRLFVARQSNVGLSNKHIVSANSI